MHCTFSTKERYPYLDSELETRLWPYIGGIARENRMKALAIGGVFDHLHALLSLPATMSFADFVQVPTRNPALKCWAISVRPLRGLI
jgi:REP element-mobilizing transposase RayT